MDLCDGWTLVPPSSCVQDGDWNTHLYLQMSINFMVI